MATSDSNTQQVITTSGTAVMTGGAWCGLDGYTCTCGAWVAYGTQHSCAPWSQWTYIPNWSQPTMPQITAFRGTVKTLEDLPSGSVQTGYAYYVEKANILVVRSQGGWFHFDSK